MLLILSLLIVAIVILLCIPATRALLVVFLIDYFPSFATIIFIIVAIILLPVAIAYSIYGSATLVVLLVLAIVSIWSPVARWITTTILIVGLLAAFFFPPVKSFIVTNYPSSVDWVSNNKEYTNTKIQESSLAMKNAIRDSEITRGTFGHISKNGVGYDDFGTYISSFVVQAGQRVKSMGKITSQDKTGNEGMIQVMFPNKHGHFVDGQLAWIPIRIITWEKKVTIKEEQTVVKKPPTNMQLGGQIVPQATPPQPAVVYPNNMGGKTVIRRVRDWQHPNGY